MKKIAFIAPGLLLFFCLVSINILKAGPVSYRFRHFTVEQGIASNTVRTLYQDSRGFIWFGTSEGLNCFDGRTITRHKIIFPSKNEFGTDYIGALLEDNTGNFWVGTEIGIYIYDVRRQTSKKLEAQTEDGTSINSLVNNIVTDKDGNLWISSEKQGVFRYNPGTGALTLFSIDEFQNYIHTILVDSENNIWISGGYEHKLAKLDKKNDVFAIFHLKSRDPRFASRILDIYQDAAGNFWCGTWDAGLQIMDTYSGEVKPFLINPDGSRIMHIHSIREIAPNQLLIGSDDGLTWFNSATGEHAHYIPSEKDPASLSNKFVYPILLDREGGIWIGTYYGGVNYVSPNNGQFEGTSCAEFTHSGSGNIISRFCEDSLGNLWIGSDDGGLMYYSPHNGKVVHYMPRSGKNSLSYHNVHALCFDDDDHLWIGTYSGGLNILNTQTGNFRHYKRDDSGYSLDDNGIYSIFKDKDNNMWVGTMTGLNIYDRKTDGFSQVRELNVMTVDIKQDTDGYIWFATFGKGLLRYNPENAEWKTYLARPLDPRLMSNHVNSICIDQHNQIWVGTEGGLCRYDKEKDSLLLYYLDIPNNNIQCIISDNDLLWLTTSNGMVCYSPDNGTFKLFTTADGLQSNYFIFNAGLKTSAGKIYFGSINGFNSFYPYRIKPNVYMPPVMITRLDISNKEVNVSEDGPLKETVSYCPDIDLTYKDNVVTIQYAALSYCSPEQNMYAYKLEGFDKDWNYVGKQNRVTYTNLPAGDYVFHVKGSNNDGLWNETGTTLNITIHPPFYLTLPFKILYYLLALLTILGTIRFFVNNAEKRHKEKIQMINQEKEVELHNAKIHFFTTIAHEIRTPVSLILAPLEKIMSSGDSVPESIKENIDIINRNSQRLLFLVNQLLDFRKIEQNGGMNVRFTSQNIYELLIDVKERFDPTMIQSGINFVFNCSTTDLTAMVHYESIIKLVSNLLTNAGKFAKSRVELSCTVMPGGNDFRICVSDDGCGIKDEEKELIFKPFYQSQQHVGGTGIGLSIVHKIVQSHNGTIEVTSEPGGGSAFIVTLPLAQNGTETKRPNGTQQGQDELPQDILSEVSQLDPGKNKPVMLIVDDNDQMLHFLADNFSDDYGILTAKDGHVALELLKNNSVSIVISDWMMPNMDGAELCKAVRNNKHTSHIPFILLTAKTGNDARIESMNCGADAHIEKPFSIRYLRACIRNLRELRNMLMHKYSKMPLVPISSIANNSCEEQFLNRMNEVIEQNFSNPELSVDFLARELCVSRSGLFAKIKSLTEVTPNELIQIVRLKKAAVLLLENKYTVSEISYMVGFNNPSYFAKCFQKQFGINPGEFARSQR